MNNINKILKEKKKSKKWLSEQLNLHPVTIYKYTLNNGQPSLEIIFKIAFLLQVKPSELINDDYLENK